MEQRNSSAHPEHLEHFARRSEEIGQELVHAIHRLEAMLLRFSERCVEYQVYGIRDVPRYLYELEQTHQELALRTRLIAHGFRNADIGGLEGLREPAPQGGDFSQPSHITTVIEVALTFITLGKGFREQIQESHTRIATYQQITQRMLDETSQGVFSGEVPLYDLPWRFKGLSVQFEHWFRVELNSALAWVGWNTTALFLDQSLRRIEQSAEQFGNAGALVSALTEIPNLILGGFATLGLIGLDDDAIGADIGAEGSSFFSLIERSFWRQQHYIEPRIFQQLTSRMDRLISLSGNHNLRPLTGKGAEPLRDPERGIVEVRPSQLFPPGPDYRSGPYRIRPGALMDGPHALISPYTGEQVSFARINHNEYVIGIYGLDMLNISSSPNGVNAVAQTAAGGDPERNPYYLTVRARVIDCIKAMPPGSALHFTGHSMGAGMVFTLLNDTLVLDALQANHNHVPSATTLGGVRPIDGANDEIEPGGPNGAYHDVLGNTEVRHYTDIDDLLAMHEGGGHDPARYPAVILFDDDKLDGSIHAHTSYEYGPYEELPPELQTLPWTIDPQYVEKYRVPPPAWRRQIPEVTDAELVS